MRTRGRGDQCGLLRGCGRRLRDRRDYSLGWRLVRDRYPGDVGSLELSLEARRQEIGNDNASPEYTLGFNVTARF